MSFNGTHTPRKGESRKQQRFQVPVIKGKVTLTEEQEKEFKRLFPKTMNPDLMGIFGISFSTLQRLKRHYGLEKDMKVIKHKQAMMIKKQCEENGYYDSMRGKAPSPQCKEAYAALVATGFHPMKALKENNPRRYKSICAKRSRMRTELMESEKRRAEIGLQQRTRLHLPQFKYSRSQVAHRSNALKRGYILGDMRENMGERYTLWYNKETDRNALFERNCQKDGFSIRELKEEKPRHYIRQSERLAMFE